MQETTDNFANDYLKPFGSGYLITIFAYTNSSAEASAFAKQIGENIQAEVKVSFSHPYKSESGILTAAFYFKNFINPQKIKNYVPRLLEEMSSVSKSAWCSFEGMGFLIGDYPSLDDAQNTYAFIDFKKQIHTAFLDSDRHGERWLKEYREFINQILLENPSWSHLSIHEIYINSFL